MMLHEPQQIRNILFDNYYGKTNTSILLHNEKYFDLNF